MQAAGIKVDSTDDARRIKWILGVHVCAAVCGGISLAWLVMLILFTSHEGECGGFEVQHDENLGKWHTSRAEDFYIGFVCERPADLGCSSHWSEFQGSCYILVCESQDYRLAQEGCLKRGAQLVSISHEAENNHVLKLCGRQPCWIGLSRPPGAKVWQWADGTAAGHFGNWTSYNRFADDAVESYNRACLNKGPPERYIEEPVFIIKAVGKFVVPSCLMFIAYLALKRKRSDMAQCLCIVDGFFAACLFAEMIIMIFRIMKGGPWIDFVGYLLFMAMASCGIAFCCACSARAFNMFQAEKEPNEQFSETESMMQEHEAATQCDTFADPSQKVPELKVPETGVSPQPLGNVKVEVCTFEVELDQPPVPPRSTPELSASELTHL